MDKVNESPSQLTPSEKKLFNRVETDTAVGAELIHVLGLHVKPNGRVDTAWGDKTPMGLARTVARIVNGNG